MCEGCRTGGNGSPVGKGVQIVCSFRESVFDMVQYSRQRQDRVLTASSEARNEWQWMSCRCPCHAGQGH